MAERPAEGTDLSALSEMAPELAQTLVSIAGDIALVVDRTGVISSVAVGEALFPPSVHEWVGQRWTDTVTGDTRRKIELLLQEAGDAGVSRRREVNLPSDTGAAIPVSYAAVRLGTNGPLLAIGRDLRAIAAIQQRFVETQQELERDYWRKRQAESRYRLLFQVATDAVMVVDGLTMRIVEANPAAAQLLGLSAGSLAGEAATAGIHPASRAAVEELLIASRSTGRPAEIRARLAQRPESIAISATPFRAESTMLLLVRARAAEAPAHATGATLYADFVERTPDAVVIADGIGRVQMANPAFVALCQLASEADWRRRSLGDWMSLQGRDLDALIAQVRSHGIAAQMPATVRGAQGAVTEVELSAALMAEGDQESIGFTLRRIAPSLPGPAALADEVLRAIEALGRELGHVSLGELVESGTRLVERHLLRSALARSAGSIAAAAAMLELSVGELGRRLRAHGLAAHGRADDDDETPPPLLN